MDEHGTEALPVTPLFQKVLFATRQFIADPDRQVRKGDSQACDLLAVGRYMQEAVSTLVDALVWDDSESNQELPIISQGASGRGSTLFVDFYSTKPIYRAEKCHLNTMVADTKKWEQSAAFALDAHLGVDRWVKNDHLGFTIPYRKTNVAAGHLPDFIAVLDSGLQLIIENKGDYDDDADQKAKAVHRWVNAMNALAPHGQWAYLVAEDPAKLGQQIDSQAIHNWHESASPLV